MDPSGIFYHIRVHRPSTFDASFCSFAASISMQWIITREGGGYCKTKHRFIRPHVHIMVKIVHLSHPKLRKLFKEYFPSVASNKDYSIHLKRKNNLLSYILKGNKIVGKQNISDDLIARQPVWIDKKVYFKEQLKNHIREKKRRYDDLYKSMSSLYRPYGYDDYLIDVVEFCKSKDRWLPRNIIMRYAYAWGYLEASSYLQKINLLKKHITHY